MNYRWMHEIGRLRLGDPQALWEQAERRRLDEIDERARRATEPTAQGCSGGQSGPAPRPPERHPDDVDPYWDDR